jgi:hypothetical protein
MINGNTTEEKTTFLFSNPSKEFKLHIAFYVHLENKVTENR